MAPYSSAFVLFFHAFSLLRFFPFGSFFFNHQFFSPTDTDSDCVEIQCNSIIKIKMLIYPNVQKPADFIFNSSVLLIGSTNFNVMPYVNSERRCWFCSSFFFSAEFRWKLCFHMLRDELKYETLHCERHIRT